MFDLNAPFGEWSDAGFHEYLETKSTLGYGAAG